MSGGAIYSYGHPESVIRSLSWRTAQNSASYLLPHLKPTMNILDVGCGPGTITADLARLVPQGRVTGIDYSTSGILEHARKHAAEQGITNIHFQNGDICNLENVPNDTYDVVHCHQVLQHVRDPVQALREMKRVTGPGGLVAVREADSKAITWFPESDTMDEFMELYQKVARANHTEPDAGRRLVSWALAAGFGRRDIDATAGTWCYSTPEERAWWCSMSADRTVHSTFATQAVEKGLATEQKLERLAQHWREWGEKEDGWLAILHGEVVCRA
ncbi:UbiE family methyltransferase [Paxillus ammoniavirescens]|nr:UbiE family methyltransferase [Paxillus ammoniavirescens]